MLHSIRWRLVASYVLVTLLTVTLIGVLALSLFRQQTVRQETEYLTANANAVARQAAPLLQPTMHQQDLQELAQTTAFMSNARIRILDPHQSVLADSGADFLQYEYVLLAPPANPGLTTPGEGTGPIILAIPLDKPYLIPRMQDEGILPFTDLPPGTEYTVIRRYDTPWGSRVAFETRRVPDSSTSTGDTSADPLASQEPDRSTRSVVQPIGDPNSPVGYVELSGGLDFGGQSLQNARQAFALAGLGATLLALVVGLVVSRGLAAPITDLTEAASMMSAGDMSARAPVRNRDEIGQLATQFNRMAARLEASFAELAAERDTLRRFIADASHELRTPITALHSFIELLQGPAAHDPAAQEEFLAESAAQVSRLEWLTHNLLDLSRLEAGLVDLELGEHDTGEVIEAAAAPFRAIAQDKGIRLAVNPPAPPLPLWCDRPRLEMALSNLLNNAMKFTPEGGQVTLSGQQADGSACLWVEDTGVGIPPEDQPHVFERFYRGRENGVEGSGLGLAIVQGIVQAHGGQIVVESQPGQGSRFTIELPLAADGEGDR